MTDQVQSPVKGQPMRASWGAAVSSAVNSLLPMGSDGLLARQGVAGTGFSPLPANLRDRRGSSAERPRQFDLRARIEARGEDYSKEYRLVVEFWHEPTGGDDFAAVRWNHFAIAWKARTDLGHGWNELYTSSWASSISESHDYFLNLVIGAELDWHDNPDPGDVVLTDETTWSISDEELYDQGLSSEINTTIVKVSYKIGSVTAASGAATVMQCFDGPLFFADPWQLFGDGGGGGGSSDDNKSLKSGRYAIVSIEGGVVTMKNPYFSVGGKTYVGSETTATLLGGSTDVVAIRISASGGSQPADSLEVYDSVPSLQAAQNNINYYTIPLFMISTGVDEQTKEETYDVVCDFRLGPDAAMGEFS